MKSLIVGAGHFCKFCYSREMSVRDSRAFVPVSKNSIRLQSGATAMIQMVSNLVFYSPELDTHNGIKKMTLNGACKCNTSGKMSKKRGIKHIPVHAHYTVQVSWRPGFLFAYLI